MCVLRGRSRGCPTALPGVGDSGCRGGGARVPSSRRCPEPAPRFAPARGGRARERAERTPRPNGSGDGGVASLVGSRGAVNRRVRVILAEDEAIIRLDLKEILEEED